MSEERFDAEITDLGIEGYSLAKPVPVSVYYLHGSEYPWIMRDTVGIQRDWHGEDVGDAVQAWCWSACRLREQTNAWDQYAASLRLREYIQRAPDAPPVSEFRGRMKITPAWRRIEAQP